MVTDEDFELDEEVSVTTDARSFLPEENLEPTPEEKMNISLDLRPHPMMTRQRARDQLSRPRKTYTQFDVQSSDILTEPMDDFEDNQFHDTSPEPLLLPDGEFVVFL